MKLFLLAFCVAFITIPAFSQLLRINEVMSSNGGALTDKDGETPDWIELFNAGTSPVNLQGYGLSDKKDQLFQWIFPNLQMEPGEYLMVYASGKDLRDAPVNWNAIIARGDDWKYLVPTSEPGSNWRLGSFDDNNWLIGKSGFGFSDNDDATIVTVTKSIFLRKKFIIGNPASISQLVLHMDYDDGFVAYLNGIEIARSQMAGKGDFPGFEAFASDQHEALMYQGLAPERFVVSNPASVLKSGENVLAIQVHNVNTTSSDLSAIPYLSIGTAGKEENSREIDLLNLTSNDFHTNFKISADGEPVYLTNPEGAIADSVRLGPLALNTSYGRLTNDPAVWAVFQNSTPGTENTGDGLSGEKPGLPVFSSPGGIYSGSLKVGIASLTDGDTIYYTVDGSVPTNQSSVYSGEIQIQGTKILRARILKSGMQPGETVTNSYISYSNKKLPVVSVSMNPADLWDYNTGIYVKGPNAAADNPYFGANFWEDWEKACHFELMEKTGDKVIDIDAGLKIYGNWSRANAQKSMALYCRKSYGSEFMKYRIFDERSFDEYKNLVLRNSGNDWNYTMFRDGLMTGLTMGLNLDQMAYRPATIFLNGEYWGILNLREKINEDFIASNHDVKAKDVILLENNGNPVVGSAADWIEITTFLQQNSLATQANYDQIAAQIDVDNFTDYMSSEIFFRNHDWPGNNIKYWKTNDSKSKWRWIIFDTDFGMGIWSSPASDNTLALATATNGPDWPNPAWSTLLLRRMLENAGYRNLFVNRFADLMNSVYLPDNINRSIDQKKDAINEEITNHLQRWGGGRYDDWLRNVQEMKNFANNRPGNVFNHIKEKFGFQNQQVLTVRTDSLQGLVQLNSLKISKFPWHGSYFPDVSVTLIAEPKAGHRFLRWDGVTANSSSKKITIAPKFNLDVTAVFEDDGSHYDDIVINEISFNNDASDDPGDWVELYNKGQFDIDISGWKITDSDPGHQFILAANTWIKANEYLVVCSDVAKMKGIFGSVKNLYESFAFSFGLSNTIDAVKLFSRDEQLIDEVSYKNSQPWPTYNLNELWSIELKGPTLDNNSGSNWVLSEKTGTPGIRNTSYFPDAVIDFPVSVHTTELLQNYPNPFIEGTSIGFKLSQAGKYKISIQDVNGILIRNIIGDDEISLTHNVFWDGRDDSGKPVLSGVYFYRLESNGNYQIKRMVKM